jgi:hypothetical protein
MYIAENIISFKKNVTKNYRGGKILLRSMGQQRTMQDCLLHEPQMKRKFRESKK